jgi:hypothetical protein
VVHMNCSFKVSCIFLPPVNEWTRKAWKIKTNQRWILI